MVQNKITEEVIGTQDSETLGVIALDERLGTLSINDEWGHTMTSEVIHDQLIVDKERAMYIREIQDDFLSSRGRMGCWCHIGDVGRDICHGDRSSQGVSGVFITCEATLGVGTCDGLRRHFTAAQLDSRAI